MRPASSPSSCLHARRSVKEREEKASDRSLCACMGIEPNDVLEASKEREADTNCAANSNASKPRPGANSTDREAVRVVFR